MLLKANMLYRKMRVALNEKTDARIKRETSLGRRQSPKKLPRLSKDLEYELQPMIQMLNDFSMNVSKADVLLTGR